MPHRESPERRTGVGGVCQALGGGEGTGMAYDEKLAERARAAVPPVGELTERAMFGGLCLMLDGHMLCGISGDRLMARLGTEAAEAALAQPHVRVMDFTGRPMKGYVYIEPAGLKGRALDRWVGACAEYVATLPPKKPKKPSARTRATH